MALFNAFRHGSTIENPPLVFQLLDEKGNPLGDKYGDFVEGDREERLGWLVMQCWGIGLGKVAEYIQRHDPALCITRPADGGRAVWSKGRGVIEGWVEFKVATISTNYNAFGLRGVILVGRDGVVYEVASGDLNLPKKGEVVRVKVEGGSPAFHKKGWEVPARKPDAPPRVIQEVWG
jgi:hypothetical protein